MVPIVSSEAEVSLSVVVVSSEGVFPASIPAVSSEVEVSPSVAVISSEGVFPVAVPGTSVAAFSSSNFYDERHECFLESSDPGENRGFHSHIFSDREYKFSVEEARDELVATVQGHILQHPDCGGH